MYEKLFGKPASESGGDFVFVPPAQPGQGGITARRAREMLKKLAADEKLEERALVRIEAARYATGAAAETAAYIQNIATIFLKDECYNYQAREDRFVLSCVPVISSVFSQRASLR